ncbi:hypothetical protein [Streptosporangium sp. NPDC002524]|uniref:acyl-CoA-like ligand-binding transcription factor n=1 Tax=Streptosporangium sp. NPDC002524 TaxID=3154537 RepID=UPI003328BE91
MRRLDGTGRPRRLEIGFGLGLGLDKFDGAGRHHPPGEPAVRAVPVHLRDEAHSRDRRPGLPDGSGRVFEMMWAAPRLTARLEDLGRQMTGALAAVLAEETGAAPDDPVPRVVAWRLGTAARSEIEPTAAAGDTLDSPGRHP